MVTSHLASASKPLSHGKGFFFFLSLYFPIMIYLLIQGVTLWSHVYHFAFKTHFPQERFNVAYTSQVIHGHHETPHL